MCCGGVYAGYVWVCAAGQVFVYGCVCVSAVMGECEVNVYCSRVCARVRVYVARECGGWVRACVCVCAPFRLRDLPTHFITW